MKFIVVIPFFDPVLLEGAAWTGTVEAESKEEAVRLVRERLDSSRKVTDLTIGAAYRDLFDLYPDLVNKSGKDIADAADLVYLGPAVRAIDSLPSLLDELQRIETLTQG